MDNLERANKSIDDFESAIREIYGVSPRINVQTDRLNKVEQIGTSMVPIKIVDSAGIAVQAILATLSVHTGSIHGRVSSLPPEWWRKFNDALRMEGLEDTSALKALRNTVAILDPYISQNSSTLAGLSFLTENMSRHFQITRHRVGNRAYDNPYPESIGLFFFPEVDSQIRNAFDELNSEIGIFPHGCISFLRDVLNETREIIE